jgi:hypothetical protein
MLALGHIGIALGIGLVVNQVLQKRTPKSAA